ncbi:hypothetical protein [Stanieria cyanosphaera PCC 7437] [Mycolicibacterium parafortuitum]|uniref:Glycosyltransferase subfamily 4-like N-terminal domain-containing protein n=1 Tax=Mycolicibacterium parafortuitum TaxID=39692 RepID=A0A375YHP3_MYCPF|nr:hypothetical protein [Stanieria cyanosphaera PCC 7437] [Mycolicibacterium parafortuitum]
MRDSTENKPRILYLTKVLPYPPAVSGDSVYSRGIIESWSTLAELTVLCAESGADRQLATSGVKWRIAGNVRDGRARSVLSKFPLIAWKGATSEFRTELDVLLASGNWDAIVLDNIGMAHALPRVQKYRKLHPKVKLVYISHEWEYSTRASKYRAYDISLAVRLVAQLDLRKVKRWEKALIVKSDIVTVITEADLAPFRMIDPARKYLLISPGYSETIVESRRITGETPKRILLLGGRRNEQKQQVLLDWLSSAYKPLTEAGIEITVAGDISIELRDYVVGKYPQVNVMGYVEDLVKLVEGARAGVIADTIGGGFKLRLLSHVFHRLPIIGLTDAIIGLPTPEGKGYLAVPTLSELSKLICEVIDDVDTLDELQNRAFHDCARAFSWQERADTLTKAIGGRDTTRLM